MLALMALGCVAVAPQENRFRPDTYSIFPGERALALTSQCSRFVPEAEGTWTPTDEDVAALEPALFRVLATELRREGRETAAEQPEAQSFYRQYGGLIVKGRRVIYVNGVLELERRSADMARLTTSFTFDWRTQTMMYCDGGSNTFGVEFDVRSRRFRNFQFNGYA